MHNEAFDQIARELTGVKGSASEKTIFVRGIFERMSRSATTIEFWLTHPGKARSRSVSFLRKDVSLASIGTNEFLIEMPAAYSQVLDLNDLILDPEETAEYRRRALNFR